MVSSTTKKVPSKFTVANYIQPIYSTESKYGYEYVSNDNCNKELVNRMRQLCIQKKMIMYEHKNRPYKETMNTKEHIMGYLVPVQVKQEVENSKKQATASMEKKQASKGFKKKSTKEKPGPAKKTKR
jgi:hypothetical protein